MKQAGGVWLRAVVLALLAGHAAFSLWPALTRIRNDFPSYYLSARAALAGRPFDRAYERTFWEREGPLAQLPTVGTFVPHPPANALLLMPVAALPPAAAKAIWTVALALMLGASFLVLRRLLPGASPWLLALAFLVQTASIRNALAYGQPYPLLLLLLCLSLLALVRGEEAAAGLLLSPVVVLKLYGLPFVLFLALVGRWRALAGVLAGAAGLVAISTVVLGADVHVAYATEVLRASLDGRVLDPYSTVWGSPASVARRLFQLEPELNPAPVADVPRLAVALGRGAAAVIVALATLGAVALARRADSVRAWAALALGSLAASPLPSTYHMVLLALPAAVLCAPPASTASRAAVIALTAFAASPLPHYVAPFAHGWGSLFNASRFAAILVLLGMALRSVRLRVPVASAAICGLLAAAGALWIRAEDAGWRRVPEARGLLAAEPTPCAGGMAWRFIEQERYRARHPDGSVFAGDPVRCVADVPVEESVIVGDLAGEGEDARPYASDVDARPGHEIVEVERASGNLVARSAGGRRVLATGRVRRPRVSPDGTWVVFQRLAGGSWDLHAVHASTGETVRVTADPANEVEPAWMPDGRAIVFASDRRRGLGATTLYVVPFAAR